MNKPAPWYLQKLKQIAYVAAAVAAIVLFVIAFSKVFLWCEKTAKMTAAMYPLWHVVLAPVCFFLGAGLCWQFAPHAVGNGIHKIRLALHKIDQTDAAVEPYMGGKLIVTKTFASWICALGGGALGREGPVVHLASALFWLFGRKMQRILPFIELRQWVVGGAAIGFAVAFQTPLAGLMFVIEELADDSLPRGRSLLLWLVLGACLLQGFIVPYAPIFSFNLMASEWISQLPLLALTAVVCGALSALLHITSRKAQAHVQERYPFWMVAPLCGLAVGGIGIWCGGQSFGGGVITLQHALQQPDASIHLPQFLGRLANTLLGAFSGNAGGLLGPSLALGAGVGSVIGEWFHLFDVRLLMMCGMAAFLSGLMAVPLTVTLLVFETTGHGSFILPFFIAAMLGHLASTTVRKVLRSDETL